MNEHKTYRDLKNWLDLMTPKELDMTATIALMYDEEAIGIRNFNRTDGIGPSFLNDVLETGHPFIEIEV